MSVLHAVVATNPRSAISCFHHSGSRSHSRSFFFLFMKVGLVAEGEDVDGLHKISCQDGAQVRGQPHLSELVEPVSVG